MAANKFFDRDLSWLSFNERVLNEAARDNVALIDRFRFIAIFSSNLDEFFRVRMPVMLALGKLSGNEDSPDGLKNMEDHSGAAKAMIHNQQEMFGEILTEQLIPALKRENIYLLYNEIIPVSILSILAEYFQTRILGYLRPIYLSKANKKFFPESNKLYLLVTLSSEEVLIINVPSDELPRFFEVKSAGNTYLVFLEDIIRLNLQKLFKSGTITGCFSFKITRDAAIDLSDDYKGTVADQIEKKLLKRDMGLATRFLYQPGIPKTVLDGFCRTLNLRNALSSEGGSYHNLKDLANIPVYESRLSAVKWPALQLNGKGNSSSLLDRLLRGDILIHTPYHSYNPVLRFFNEAATDPSVLAISVTLYRIANNSGIVSALISAAKNGKRVLVMIELKARFDEANNLKWAKIMAEAGVEIVYTATTLKVHAKIALVKRKMDDKLIYAGLFSTGNLNENTACFYTDHILLTSHRGMLKEIKSLFELLKRKTKHQPEAFRFRHLLVAQYNLKNGFLKLIENEIENAKKGVAAELTIKLNNLEEEILIAKLYTASGAGVKINLIIRSICRLVPGVIGLSENITVKRIVGRYLEHGRVFIFHNAGDPKIYLGSADWMNRNIYHRIEVCFPVLQENYKNEILDIIQFQLADNVQAVTIDENLKNIPVPLIGPPVESQLHIYQYLNEKNHK